MKFLIASFLSLFLISSCSHTPKKEMVGYDKLLSQIKYPHEVKKFSFKSQGQKLFMKYMDMGDTNLNEAVVFLHGKNFGGQYWFETAQHLVKDGHRVIIIDQVGFGKSSKPTTYQFTFHQLAFNTKLLLEHANVERVKVVGHSMGGMLATRFALSYPQFVSSLTLVNPIGLEDVKRVIPYQSVDQVMETELNQTPESIKEYQRISYYDGKWNESYDAWIDMLVGWIKGPDKEIMAKVSALTYDMIFTQPVLYEFPDLKVKTLLIIGDRDRTAVSKNRAPKELQAKLGRYDLLGPKIQKMIPRSKLVVLKGLGHLPHIESFPAFYPPLRDYLKN